MSSNINGKLEQQFRSAVYIEPVLKAEADQIYNLVKSEVRNYISQYKNDAVTMVDMGSSSDGLKVVAPDEYDVMLVVETTNLDPSRSQEVPGYYYMLRTQGGVSEGARRWRWLELDGCVKDGYLRADMVRNSFQSMMQTVVNGHTGSTYKLHIRQSGPAIEVGVSWSGKSLTIDFVPAVKVNGEFFVATPLLDDVRDRNFLWRKSYINQEKQNISGFSENLRKAVMIWKAAQINSSQLQGLSSYHFKTIGMMLARRSGTSWLSLEECVTAIRDELLSALEMKRLPSAFDPGVDLFARKEQSSLENVKNFVLRHKEGEKLLRMLGA